MDPYLWKRLLRRPYASLCTLIMSLVLCLFMGYIFQYRDIQQDRLADTHNAYQVLCVVTNNKGTTSRALRMYQGYLDFVRGPDAPMASYIKELRLTKEFKYSAPQWGIGVGEEYDSTPLTGITGESCAEYLNPECGVQVTYLVKDFYERSDYVCLVPEKLYIQLNGESLVLHVTDPYLPMQKGQNLGQGEVEFQVVGYYAALSQEIYIPFDSALVLAQELSQKLSCDSIAFVAADNTKLEALSKAASSKFSVADPTAADRVGSGYALTIRDEQYRAAVTVLEQNIQRANLLLPILLLLGAGVGFLASFLSTRNECKTYALMRTLGMTGRKLFFSVLREQFLLAALAAALALPVFRAVLPIAVYLGCYLVGTIACITRTLRVSPTAILRAQE